MDQITQSQNPVSEPEYRTLGRKTFWLFLAQRIHAAVIFFLIMVGLFAIDGQGFLAKTPFGDIRAYITFAAAWSVVVFVIVAALTVLIVWLIYRNYLFAIDTESLKIRRGVLSREEIAIPYRQIQDVDIERPLSYRMFGMSSVVILTAGHEDEPHSEDESEGMLPAIDKAEAEWLQAELLKRTSVQRVVEEKIPEDTAPPQS